MASTVANGTAPDLEKSASRLSQGNIPPKELLAGEADTELLGISPSSACLMPDLTERQPSSDINKSFAETSL